jgi:hypothetical protein
VYRGRGGRRMTDYQRTPYTAQEARTRADHMNETLRLCALQLRRACDEGRKGLWAGGVDTDTQKHAQEIQEADK